MEAPNSKPKFLQQEERYHWNWYPAPPNALGNRMLRARARGLETKRRLNGSQLRDTIGYFVTLAIENKHERFVPFSHGVQFDFKMYKRVGSKKKKKKYFAN